MNRSDIIIRKAVEGDSEQLWLLMQQLAVFENYSDVFSITPDIVKEGGFRKNPPDFFCFVATDKEVIAGMLVYYFLPYTAQNRPSVYLKELYVAEDYRNLGIGEQLMQALYAEAKAHNCLQVQWKVAPWNGAGQRFYERLGAIQNTAWLSYEWNI